MQATPDPAGMTNDELCRAFEAAEWPGLYAHSLGWRTISATLSAYGIEQTPVGLIFPPDCTLSLERHVEVTRMMARSIAVADPTARAPEPPTISQKGA